MCKTGTSLLTLTWLVCIYFFVNSILKEPQPMIKKSLMAVIQVHIIGYVLPCYAYEKENWLSASFTLENVGHHFNTPSFLDKTQECVVRKLFQLLVFIFMLKYSWMKVPFNKKLTFCRKSKLTHSWKNILPVLAFD